MTLTSNADPIPIPVTLLTGFLGSGKTTILNHVMQQPAMADTLVIINEFGEIALDHLLVTHSTENVVKEMSNGCICCTIRGDLAKTLRDLTWRFSRNGKRQFHRVLIETTGLADPAPIIHTLMTDREIGSRYRLDGIVTVIDMASGNHTLNTYKEAIKQAAVADCLLLTKADLTTPQNKAVLLQRLNKINPAAFRQQVEQGQIEAEKFLDLGLFSPHKKIPDVDRWLKEEAYSTGTERTHAYHRYDEPNHGHSHAEAQHHNHDINHHDDHIRAFCFSEDKPITEESYLAWLDILMAFVGSNILRVKGILNIAGYDHPMVIHGVQHIFHPPVPLPAWPSEDRRSKIVFITRDVERESVEWVFQFISNSPVRS